MRTVSIFSDGNDQVISFPDDMAYEGVEELEITRDGDTITLKPARKGLLSLLELPEVNEGLSLQCPDIVGDEGGG